jgi:hypothetical protein
MEVSDFKELLNEVKCGTTPSLGFTEEDLANVKSCIDKVQPIQVDEIEAPVIVDESCIPEATLALQKILEDQQQDLIVGLKHGILKAKVQELRDNLDIVKAYYDSRTSVLSDLLSLSTDAAKTKLDAIPQLPKFTETELLLQTTISNISNQLLAKFSNQATTTVPALVATFTLRLINKDKVIVKLPDPKTSTPVDTVIPIFDNPFLDKPIFDPLLSFSVIKQDAYNPDAKNNPDRQISDYDFIPGLLYNGIPNNPYKGLYRKMAKPLTYLYTLEERGLTVNPNLIDPKLKEVKDAPTSIREEDVTYYILNQQTYEAFYGSLADSYTKKAKAEKEVVYPATINSTMLIVKDIASREAADIFRKKSNIPTVLQFYKTCNTEIDQLIVDCDAQIVKLNDSIKKNTMDEDSLKIKVQGIPCFAGVPIAETDPDCEKAAYEKLGTDPLYLRTMFSTNAGLPDISSQCYWKEFAKALNKVSLLPYPDLTGPPPINTVFRYWPINCIIPAGIALVLLPVPPIWKPLFVIPTPIGTLMCMLSLPIVPIGIPLPSVYLFYFAPDGTKYLILAVNLPQLYSNPTKNPIFGFQLDNSEASRNPLGLSPTNPYKGYPIKGAFTQPLTITSKTSKALRLAKLASDIASGKNPIITNINGGELPFSMSANDYANSYLSEEEMMLKIVDAKPANEFSRQVIQLKTKVNKQIDKLGEMQLTQVNVLKEKVRLTRTEALTEAEKEEDLATRRKAKQFARAINPLTLNEKIASVTDDFLKHIDNIKFGTIRFPKDATKYNPGLPEALTSIFDLIELGSVGDLKIDKHAKSLNTKIKNALAKINVNKITTKTEFDLNKEDDVTELKTTLGKMVDETIAYLRGDIVSFDLSAATSEEEAKAMIVSNRKLQETARDAMAFISVALLNPPKITMFDLTKKCCEVQSKPLFSGVPPQLAVAFAIMATLMQAIIDGLTPEAIAGFIGTESKMIQTSFVTTLFDSLVSVIPQVTLPDPANLMTVLQAVMIPVLALISIPKAINPFQTPMIPIVIPLDAIFKPLIKTLIAALIAAIFKLLQDSHTTITGGNHIAGLTGTNGVYGLSDDDKKSLEQVFSSVCGLGTTVNVTTTTELSTESEAAPSHTTMSISVDVSLPDGTHIHLPTIPFIALDLMSYFQLLTSADIIEFIRQLVNSVFDIILAPLQAVIDLISKLAISFNSFSYNIIEAAIPLLSAIKLIRMLIDSKIPASVKLQILNTDMMNLIQLTLLPALELVEPVLKQVAWIGTTALCALGSPVNGYLPVSVARMVHPIMNCDDLPPWERLTHKNPLFAIFLDEIAWRGSLYATGSLIFQTKTPAVLPYSLIFPIVHVTPHLT